MISADVSAGSRADTPECHGRKTFIPRHGWCGDVM
ncbi:unnamed protein product [Ectocarpus sp. 12 AP-2014]